MHYLGLQRLNNGVVVVDGYPEHAVGLVDGGRRPAYIIINVVLMRISVGAFLTSEPLLA